MSIIDKKKKIILIIFGILSLLILLPFVQIVGEIIFEGGRMIGNLIRVYSEMNI